ncbi:MAG: hypothetical protein ACD_61C00275G0006 [uncultured bacterium]|nr:MAG: hypothetical protein ACD_61C00275G0006 [uncultured bacterium]
MDSAVNSLFSEVLPGKKNSEVFNETCDIDCLREEVVARLAKIEEDDSCQYWWQDKQLRNIFESVYKSGCILLPRDAVERLRWIAILCLQMSKIEGFSCGNVIIPPDFLPDDMMEMWVDVYGLDVVGQIAMIRMDLAKQGWEAIFPGW